MGEENSFCDVSDALVEVLFLSQHVLADSS